MANKRFIRFRILTFINLILMAYIASKDLDSTKNPADGPFSACGEYLHQCLGSSKDYEHINITVALMKNNLIHPYGSITNPHFWIQEYPKRSSDDPDPKDEIRNLCKIFRHLVAPVFDLGISILIIIWLLMMSLIKATSDSKMKARVLISVRREQILNKEFVLHEYMYMLSKKCDHLMAMLNIRHDKNIIAYLSRNSEIEMLDWLLTCKPHLPLNKNRVFVYPAFKGEYLERFSSFSRIPPQDVPEFVYFSKLAAAGFKYIGRDLEIQCQGCWKVICMRTALKFPAECHEQGCTFAQAEDSDSSETEADKETLATGKDQNPQFQKQDLVSQNGTLGRNHEQIESFDDIEDDAPFVTTTTPNNLGPDLHAEMASQHFPNIDRKFNENGDVKKQYVEKQSSLSAPENGRFPGSAKERISDVRRRKVQKNQFSEPAQADITEPSTTDENVGNQAAALPGIKHGYRLPGPSENQIIFSIAKLPGDVEVDLEEFDPEIENSDQSVQISKETCKKNPGHFGNFPMFKFRLDHIPKNAQHPDVLRFFSLVATLTVKITVGTSSKGRPECSNTGPKLRYGTGFAFAIPDEEQSQNSNDDEHPGKIDAIKKFLHFGKKKDFLYIETNQRLIYDNEEAHASIVEFFFDNPNRKGIVTAKGVSILHSSVPGDCKSLLRCKTSDLSLINVVKQSRNKIEMLAKGFPRKIKEGLMKRVFVISHPHGGEKMMSYGNYVMVKYALKAEKVNGQVKIKTVKINNHTQISQNPDEIRKVLLYTGDTCPGSIGAAVIHFKMTGAGDTEDIVLDLWMHHGIEKKSSLNASAMRVLTHEDVANHGRPAIFRPSIQDEVAAESDSAANRPASYPIFTVSSPPTHPAYADCRKRLASYPEPFNHVHTKTELADAGFFYSGYGDCVRCFHCGLGLRSWRQGDSIYEEHGRNRPDCQFLQLKLRARGVTQGRVQPSQNQTQQLTTGQRSANSEPQTASGVRHGTHLNQPNRTVKSLSSSAEEIVRRNSYSWPNVPPQEMIVGMALQEPVVNGVSADAHRNPAMAVLQREQRYLKQLLTCKVCFRNPIKDLFMPCGELVACSECSKLLTHCPTCNQKILATVTTYFS